MNNGFGSGDIVGHLQAAGKLGHRSKVGCGGARTKGHHPHAPALALNPQALAEAEDEGLGGGIEREVGNGLKGSGGGNVDDLSLAPIEHGLQEVVC